MRKTIWVFQQKFWALYARKIKKKMTECIRLGKLERDIYFFVRKHKDSGWTTYSNDPITKKVVLSLKRKSIIKTNKFNQFKIAKDIKIC
mgnify:CR=1 FL=1